MSGRRPALAAGLLVLLAGLAFLPAVSNGPIEDDLPLLRLRLAGVHSLADLPPLFGQSYWGDLFAGGLWRPLTLVTLGLERLAFGERLWVYRVVSLLLHAVATLGVWRLAARLFAGAGTGDTAGRDGRAWLAAAAFAAHPIHAEAVATVYGQADLWAAVLAIAAICLASRPSSDGRQSAWRTGAIAAMFFFSLGFKESAVALPLAVWWLQTVPGRRRPSGAVWAMLAALAVYLPMRWLVLHGEWVPGVTAGGEGVGGRFVAIIVALATDLRLMLLPWKQTIYYGHLRERLLAGGTIEFFALLATAIVAQRIARPPDAAGRATRGGLVLLGVFLLPIAQFVPIGMLAAERTLYLPSVGLCLILAGLLPKVREWRGPLQAGVVAVLLLEIGLCWRVAGRWRDERTAWETTLADHPRSARTIAEVVRLRLDEPAIAGDKAARATLHRMLDDADRITPASYSVAVARAKLAIADGDGAAAGAFAAEAERLRQGPAVRPDRPDGSVSPGRPVGSAACSALSLRPGPVKRSTPPPSTASSASKSPAPTPRPQAWPELPSSGTGQKRRRMAT
ncbi:MAG: hypothetical protein QM754_04615 [Tepidisphaeraceae bacterium]